MVTVDPAEVSTDPNNAYFDKATLKKLPFGSPDWDEKVQEQIAAKKGSNTLYVGNLSFQTTEEQIFELFSLAGEVKLVIMGLDREHYTPCGFCFVEYFRREDAESCMRFLNGTKLDERVIRTDWDAGFIEGRQFGRGKSGGQVRDEYRRDYDPDRGGFGRKVEEAQFAMYEMISSGVGRPEMLPPVLPTTGIPAGVTEKKETETISPTPDVKMETN
ncbi:Nuclear cap-binding protein subunit 2 [Oopsacas minuta]|uniref:Nuclear cap-binding protein subunit 2 n=1 Tax=Oopsacas minuta TaxID=111878 RepID=A0AAV7KCY8_9METZ|nr:Nuclear cap-binding protein subunit 2 [Oopsacas minuta]